MRVGQRVILNTLQMVGDFGGTISDISGSTCTVILDSQKKPVTDVLFFDEKPNLINSSIWQICYPEITKEQP